MKEPHEKEVYSNLGDDTVKEKPKCKLGQLAIPSFIRSVSSSGESTNYSNEVYSITEVFHDTIPSFRINYLCERYNDKFLRSRSVTLDENNKVMKKLISIQKYNKW